MASRIPLSVLDLMPFPSGVEARTAVDAALHLVRRTEELGYHRYWVAEHHNLHILASSVPLAVLAAASQLTSRIRLGSGGVMLPNHAPLSVAEGYRLLSALAPHRVDLGVGRTSGADDRTTRALQGHLAHLAEARPSFDSLIDELMAVGTGNYPPNHPLLGVVAAPSGPGLFPPVWILSSSGGGAQLAGRLGMGFALALHINPNFEQARAAVGAYRDAFQPSAEFTRPQVMASVSVMCAPTEREASELTLPVGLLSLNLRKRKPSRFPSVEEAKSYIYSRQELKMAEDEMRKVVKGTPCNVVRQLRDIVEQVELDELLVVTVAHDPEVRHRSYALLIEAESW